MSISCGLNDKKRSKWLLVPEACVLELFHAEINLHNIRIICGE